MTATSAASGGLGLMVVATGILGCGYQRAAGERQNQLFQRMAETSCRAFARCGQVGERGDFADQRECLSNLSQKFEERWARARGCGDPKLSRLAQCEHRALAAHCDSDIVDVLLSFLECNQAVACPLALTASERPKADPGAEPSEESNE